MSNQELLDRMDLESKKSDEKNQYIFENKRYKAASNELGRRAGINK